jgi:hypothetical protein
MLKARFDEVCFTSARPAIELSDQTCCRSSDAPSS